MPSETPPVPGAAPPARPNRKLFDREWLEIVSMAKNGTAIAKIAEIYDVHHTVLYRGLRKRGVRIGSLASEASEEEKDRNRELLVKRIQETKDKDYRFTEFLQAQIVKVVSDAMKGGSKIGSAIDDVKTLKIAIDGVRNGTDNKWRILGLDRENEDADAALPELPIREMSPFEVESIRNRQNLEDGQLSPEDLAAAMDITDGLVEVEDEGDEDEAEPDEAAF